MNKRKIVFVIITALCMIGTAFVVYAWFTNQKMIAMLNRIHAPNALYLNAGHLEDSIYFKMDKIDVEAEDENSDPICEKYYVFSVTGEAVSEFTLQIAHTTNNPFTYAVYSASQSLTEPDGGIYVPYTVTEDYGENPILPVDGVTTPQVVYYTLGSPLVGAYLNKTSDGTGSSLNIHASGDQDYHDLSYEEYSHIQQHAIPLYWQSRRNEGSGNNKGSFAKYYILKITWPEGLRNSKETDIVYITAGAE